LFSFSFYFVTSKSKAYSGYVVDLGESGKQLWVGARETLLSLDTPAFARFESEEENGKPRRLQVIAKVVCFC
jgi:hypothetical protein